MAHTTCPARSTGRILPSSTQRLLHLLHRPLDLDRQFWHPERIGAASPVRQLQQHHLFFLVTLQVFREDDTRLGRAVRPRFARCFGICQHFL